jgi:predicted site-specific integrase-resolvase
MNRIYTLRVLSREINLNYHTLRRWCRTGKIAHSRTPGGQLCLTTGQVDQLIQQMEQRREDPASPASAK